MEERNRFQSQLLDAAGQAVIATDPEGKIIYCNPVAERLYGWSVEEAMGRSIVEVTTSGELVERAAEVISALMAGRSWSGEFMARRKDGTIFPAMITSTPVHDEQGKRVAIIGVSMDITEIKKTEELRRSEERFRSLVRNPSDGITVVDVDGTILYDSPDVERVLGYEPEERVGTNTFEYLGPSESEQVTRMLAGILASPGARLTGEMWWPHKDGSFRYVEVSPTNLLEDPAVRGIVINWRDVTERKRAEEALRESEERFRSTFDQAAIGMAVNALDGRYVQVNRALCEMLGYSEEELLATTFLAVTHPDDLGKDLDRVRRMLEGEADALQVEKRYLHANGHAVWVSLNTSVVRNSEGSPLHFIAQIQDITERKKAQAREEASEAELRVLFSAMNDLILVLDSEGRCLRIAPTNPSLLYKPPAELAGKTLREVFPQEQAEVLLRHIRQALETQQTVYIEYSLPTGGEEAWFSGAITSMSEDQVFLVARDITERKRAEEVETRQARHAALRAEVSTALAEGGTLRSILQRCTECMVRHLDAAFARIWIFNEQQNMLELRASVGMYTRLDGAYSRVPIGKFKIGHIAQDRQPHLTNDVANDPLIGDKEWAAREGMVAFAGHPLIVEDRLVGVMAMFAREALPEDTVKALGTVADVIAQDIERKRAEEARSRLAAIVDSSDDAIMGKNLECVITSWNRGAERIYGYSSEEVVGEPTSILVPPDRLHEEPEILDRIRRGEAVDRYETTRVTKDGRRIDVWLTVSPVEDSAGNIVGASTIARDITERKRTEESLRDSLDVLLALNEAGRLLGTTLEPEEIGSRLLEIMRRISGLTTAVVSLRDEGGRLKVWRAIGLEDLRPKVRYAPEAQKALQDALEKEAARVFALDPSGDGPSVGLCLPFRVRERVVGVLEAYGSDGLADSRTIEILGSLATQAASALENGRLYQDLAERERRLRELVGRLLGAQEEERRRVAYEVHDGLAQVAASAHQHLQAYAFRYPSASQKSERDLDRALGLVQQTVKESRRIIAGLRPTALDDFGLASAVAQEVGWLRDEGWIVDYEHKLGDERLPEAIETALYRVAREALTNAYKHANTRKVRLELSREDGTVRLRVRDQGQGFDPATLNTGGPGERVGLAGMRERIVLLGGKFELRSSLGEGTSICVEVPLPPADENRGARGGASTGGYD